MTRVKELVERLEEELRKSIETAAFSKEHVLKALVLLFNRFGDLLEKAKTCMLEDLIPDIRDKLRKLKLREEIIDKIIENIREVKKELERDRHRTYILGFKIVNTDCGRTFGISFKLSPLSKTLRRLLENALTYKFHERHDKNLVETWKSIGIVGEDEVFIPHLICDELLTALKLLGAKVEDVLTYYNESRSGLIRKWSFELPEGITLPKLRGYQIEAIEAWLKNGGRGIIVLPTGTGKTLIALEIIRRLRVPTLIIVPYTAIEEKWRQEILSKLGMQAVSPRGESARLGIAPIVITTERGLYELMKRRSGLLRFFLSRALVIIDEVHHVGAPTYLSVLLSFNPKYILGLTATPEREDRNEYPVYIFMGGIVYAKPYPELAREGYVAPVLVEFVQLDLKEDVSRLKRELASMMSEFERKGFTARAKVLERIIREIERIVKGDKSKKIAPLSVLVDKLREALASGDMGRARKIMAKLDQRLEILRAVEAALLALQEVMKGKNVIIFVRYRETADFLKRLLEEGLNFPVALITGDVKELDKVYTGHAKVVVATQAGEEGVDLPDLDVAIFANIPESTRVIIQRIGRVTRPRPGKVAKVYMIYFKNFSFEKRHASRAMAVIFEEYPQALMRQLASRVRAGKVELAKMLETYVKSERARLLAKRYPRGRIPLSVYYSILSKIAPHLPWIFQWFRDVLDKRPNELTPFDKAMLLLIRMMLDMEVYGNTMPIAVDIASGSKPKNVAKTVRHWLTNPRAYDLPGVDTPEAKWLYKKLKKFLKRGEIDRAIDYIIACTRESFKEVVSRYLVHVSR